MRRGGVALVAIAAGALLTLGALAWPEPPSAPTPLGTASAADLLVRNDLGVPIRDPEASGRFLLRLAQFADAHVLDDDAPPPLRFEWLDPAGAPVQGARRPHEEYTDEILATFVATVNSENARLPFDFAISTGDAIDNALENEQVRFQDAMDGKCRREAPMTGPLVFDPQEAPSLPFHPPSPGARAPGLPEAMCLDPARAGLAIPWYETLGNHNAMVQGNGNVYPPYNAIAEANGRRFLTPRQYVAGNFGEGFCESGFNPSVNDHGHGFGYVDLARLCGKDPLALGYYSFDLRSVHVVVLDTSTKDWPRLNAHAGRVPTTPVDGTAGGFAQGGIDAAQFAWLQEDLKYASGRPTLIFAHHTLSDFLVPDALPAQSGFVSGRTLAEVLSRYENVVAYVGGHSHRHRVTPVAIEGGHAFWNVETASLIDLPMEGRAITLVELGEGVGALDLRVLGVDLPGARALAEGDDQRDEGAAGSEADRNVRLIVSWS